MQLPEMDLRLDLNKLFQSQKIKVLDFIGGSDINSQIIIGDTLLYSNVM
jgi:hypothetical protein